MPDLSGFFQQIFFFSFFLRLALRVSTPFTLGKISASVGSGMLQGEGTAQPGWNATCLSLRVPAVNTDEYSVLAACGRWMKDNTEIRK